MLEQAKMRTLPVINRTADLAPAAQACCGACRTCVQTNILGAALTAVTALSLWLGRRIRRAGATETS